MPEYIITIVKRTAIGQVIRVEGATLEAACKSAVEYGLSKAELDPIEIFPWTCGVESIEDSDYAPLDVPLQFLDPAGRIEALEQMLRTVIDSAENVPLPELLSKEAKRLLANSPASI